jgi:hypothetical protein
MTAAGLRPFLPVLFLLLPACASVPAALNPSASSPPPVLPVVIRHQLPTLVAFDAVVDVLSQLDSVVVVSDRDNHVAATWPLNGAGHIDTRPALPGEARSGTALYTGEGWANSRVSYLAIVSPEAIYIAKRAASSDSTLLHLPVEDSIVQAIAKRVHGTVLRDGKPVRGRDS